MILGMEPAGTGLEQMICFQLYAASRAMTARYRPALDAAGLTLDEFRHLYDLLGRFRVNVT
jgi:hypothetical protein